jgi:uncharacterized protein YndB with AHSA1/START domain
MDANAEPIVVEQTYGVPAEAVWKAITDKDQMRQWFFEAMTEFEPETGFETQFVVRVEDTDYQHLWKVTEVIPQKRIAYDWKYGGFPGESMVVWELSETTDGTKLTLTHSEQESFAQDNPIFSRESGVAGWNYFLGQSLKAFLERSVAPSVDQ